MALLMRLKMIYYILYESDLIIWGILGSNYKSNFKFLKLTGYYIIDITSFNNYLIENS